MAYLTSSIIVEIHVSRVEITREMQISSRPDTCYRGSMSYDCIVITVQKYYDYINSDGTSGTASRIVSIVRATGSDNYLSTVYSNVGYYDYSRTVLALEKHLLDEGSKAPANSPYRRLAEDAYSKVVSLLDFVVDKGQLSFDSEGQEGGPFNSRTPHVPSDSSGVTIGRGYDLKERTETEVVDALTAAGLTSTQAVAYSKGVRLQGQEARNFIKSSSLTDITPSQQKKLFIATYLEKENEVKRICQKSDTVDAYGTVNWDTLDFRIKEVLTDLAFRGDYTPDSRKIIQKNVSNNDLAGFRDSLSSRDKWAQVPMRRFKCRIAFLNNRPSECN
jgi:hypothetical protein